MNKLFQAYPANTTIKELKKQATAHNPFMWTTMAGICCLPFWASGEESSIYATSIIMSNCLILDAFDYSIAKRFKKTRKEEDQFVQIVGDDYFDLLVKRIKGQFNKQGELEYVESETHAPGTVAFKEGYNLNVTLFFEDGEVDLFYKFNDNYQHEKAKQLTEILRLQGLDFIPEIIDTEMDNYYGDPFTKITNAHRGVIYSSIEGKSLEDKLEIGFSPKVQDKEIDIMTIIKNALKLNTTGAKIQDQLTIMHFRRFDHLFHKKLLDELPTYLAVQLDWEMGQVTHSTGQLIHGDLHPGNVLENGEFVDLDNAQYGFFYHDMFHFITFSDLDRAKYWQPLRTGLINIQKEIDPTVTDQQIVFLEIANYLRHLSRYNKLLKEDMIEDEHIEHMKRTAKYLIYMTETKIDNYCQLTQTNELQKEFIKYKETELDNLENVELDMMASVAYAHRVNHKHRKIDKEELLEQNLETHIQAVDGAIHAEHMARLRKATGIAGIFGLQAIMASTMLISIAAGDGREEIKQAVTNGLAGTYALIGAAFTIGYLQYTQKNIISSLAKGINYFSKSFREQPDIISGRSNQIYESKLDE